MKQCVPCYNMYISLQESYVKYTHMLTTLGYSLLCAGFVLRTSGLVLCGQTPFSASAIALHNHNSGRGLAKRVYFCARQCQPPTDHGIGDD